MANSSSSPSPSALPPILPPEATPWFFRRMGFFMWNTFRRGILKNYQPLDLEDIPPVEQCENPLTIVRSQGIPIVPLWKSVRSLFRNPHKIDTDSIVLSTSSSFSAPNDSILSLTNKGGLSLLLSSCRLMDNRSVIKWFIRLDYHYFLLSGGGFLLLAIGQISIPYLVQKLLELLENSSSYSLDTYMQYGTLFISAMVGCVLCQFIGAAFGWLPACQMDYRSEIVLTALTGLKGLLLSSKVRDNGEQQFLFSKYSTVFTDYSIFGNLHFDTWVVSSFLVIGLINLIYLIGYAGLLAFSVQLLCTFLAFRVRSYVRNMDRQTNVYSQIRLRMLGEALGSMKEFRSIGWDQWFFQRMQYIRSKEILILRRSSLLKVIVDVGFALMEIATLITAFLSYAVFYPDHPLSATSAFATITWVLALTAPMKGLPAFIQQIMDVSVSIKAIKDNLEKSEVSLSKIHDQWKTSSSSSSTSALDNWGLNEGTSTTGAKRTKPLSSESFDFVARELQKLLDDAAKRVDDDLSVGGTGSTTPSSSTKQKDVYKQSLNKDKYLDDSFAVTVQGAEEKDLLDLSSLDALSSSSSSSNELTIDTLSSATGTYQPISFDNLSSSNIASSSSAAALSVSNGPVTIRMDEVSLGIESKPTNIVRLYDLSLTCTTASLSLCVGRTGSGKSLLLKSLIGDVDILAGSIEVQGKIAYVSQDPWLQRLTLRDNICFQSSYQPIRYDDIVRACALDSDFQVFTDKDQMLVVDDGSNLSGGQRVRLALARAVYTNADIYVLDDIFAALDLKVAEHVWNEVIVRLLLQNGRKTVIMATHSLQFLSRPEVSTIYLLDKEGMNSTEKAKESSASKGWQFSHSVKDGTPGRIIAKGKYKDIMQNPVATFLHEFAKEKTPMDRLSTDGVTDASVSSDNTTTVNTSTGTINYGSIIDKQSVPTWNGILCYIQSIGWLRGSLLITFYIASQSVNILQSWWLKLWTEKSNSSGSSNLSAAQIYSGIGVGYGFLILFRMVTLAVSLNHAGKVLHDRALQGIFTAPLSFFATHQSGEIYSRFEGDVKHIDLFIRPNVTYGATALFTLLASIVVIILTSPWVLLWIAVIAILFVRLGTIYRKSVMKVRSIEAAARSSATTYWKEIESNNGASFIRALGPKSVAFAIFRLLQRMEIVMRTHIASKSGSSFASSLFALFGNSVSIAASVAVLGFGYGTHPVITVASAGLLLSYSYSFPAAIYALVTELGYLEQSAVSIQRLVDYVSIEDENTVQNRIYHQTKKDTSPIPSVDSSIHVKITGLGLRYDHNNIFSPWSLRNVNVEFPRGKKIAIVGRTGSGKSSLLNCLLRLYPYEEGSIYIDNTNINHYTNVEVLRSRLAVLTQNPVLFHGTLRENLFGTLLPLAYCTDRMDTEISSSSSSSLSQVPRSRSMDNSFVIRMHHRSLTDTEIMRFLENNLPLLYQKLRTFPDGLDTILHSDGKADSLSKGEKALVNIARLLLYQYLAQGTDQYRSLILMDEPSADIDVECDRLFHKVLFQRTETIIAICHRKEYLPLFDYIVVMNEGTVQHMITSEQYVQITQGSP